MPVAAATLGVTPRESKAGLYMEPPPSPKAPATQPPPNPMIKSKNRFRPSNITSPSTKFTQYFFRRSYSFLFIFTDMYVTAAQINKNDVQTPQYA
jgi:hypothetical protein